MKLTIILVFSLFILACSDTSEKTAESNTNFKKTIKRLEQENLKLKKALLKGIATSSYSFNTVEGRAFAPPFAKADSKVRMDVMIVAYDTDKQPIVNPNQGTVVETKDGKAVVEFTTPSGGEMKLTGTVGIQDQNGELQNTNYETRIMVLEEEKSKQTEWSKPIPVLKTTELNKSSSTTLEIVVHKDCPIKNTSYIVIGGTITYGSTKKTFSGNVISAALLSSAPRGREVALILRYKRTGSNKVESMKSALTVR